MIVRTILQITLIIPTIYLIADVIRFNRSKNPLVYLCLVTFPQVYLLIDRHNTNKRLGIKINPYLNVAINVLSFISPVISVPCLLYKRIKKRNN